MHSVTLDSSASPKKRTFSRGVSEDESLRSIIQENESSSRRLTRSDSRGGTLKKRSDSQSDQDLFMGLPEMLELQASYDEAVQELRGLEVEREALLFQVDVLQDTLESVEELLAETQREAGQASLELEREKEARRNLESMVRSLMQEVERLKEERNSRPFPSVNMTDEAVTPHQITNEDNKLNVVTHRNDIDSALHETLKKKGGLAAVKEVGEGVGAEEKQWKMVNKPVSHLPSLALHPLPSKDGVIQRPCENSIAVERDPSPDRNDSDSVSAYEDASAETPEQDRIFLGEGNTLELPDDSENKEKSPTDHNTKTQDHKNPDGCILS
ncbi:uncharacterized protein KZ484_001154 isoform 2-T2 [Pholidichthys leucotaenia]